MIDFVNTVDSIGDEALTSSIIDRSITEILDNYATCISDYAFYTCTALTTVNFSAVTSIGNYAFRDCSALTTVNFSAVTSIGNSAFYGCSALTTADFPAATSIGNGTFRNCSKLTTLILRSGTMAKLDNTNAFSSTPIASGTGYIYVPSALVDTYKAATNWSTYTNQIRAIEDYPSVCSYTGKVWRKSNITSGYFLAVTCANGLWVAGSNSNSGLYYSEDGKVWTKSNITSGSFNNVSYANGLWVAGGSSLYYSEDGKVWTQSNITSGGFNAVSYANSRWVACGSSIGLYYSD